MRPVEPLQENAVRELFEALAATAPPPSRTDLEAARLAWQPPSGRAAPRWMPLLRRGFAALRRRPWVAVPALVALAAVLLLTVVAGLPSFRLADPSPATTPSGPGALPATLWAPPPGTPSVGDAPISRAAYVLSALDGAAGWRVAVVGADRGEYRLLPYGEADDGFSLSADGRTAAWLRANGDGGHLVVVLDLTTGRTREVRVPGQFGRGVTVDHLAVSPTGDRVLLVGGDPFGGGLGFASAYLVDLRSGTPTRLTLPLEGVAWTSDGRPVLAVPPEPLVDRSVVPAGALVAPDRAAGREGGLGGIGPGEGLVVSQDGRTRYEVRSAVQDSSGTVEDWTVQLTGDRSANLPLGSGVQLSPLAALPGDRLVLRLWEAGEIPAAPQAVRVRLVGADGTLTEVSRTADGAKAGVDVVAVARDVAAGGVVTPGVRPEYGPRDVTWWAWYARQVLPVVPWVLVGVLLLVLIVDGRRVLALPVRTARRAGRLVRGHRRSVLATLLGLAGIALSLAPGRVDAAWLGSAPSPSADARAVRPEYLWDQTIVPSRAFDTAGRPRTHAVTTLWAGTVAGREGWYGTDAGTARIVRLDDVPGLPDRDPDGALLRNPASLRISENGRAVLARTRAAVYVIRLDRATAGRVDVLPDGATRDTPLAVGDDGTVLTDPDPVDSRRGSSVRAMHDTRVELDAGSVRDGPYASWGAQVQAVPPVELPWWGFLGWPGWRVVGGVLLAATSTGWLVPFARRRAQAISSAAVRNSSGPSSTEPPWS